MNNYCILNSQNIEIYTDGSCNPQYQIGGWAALIFYNNEKVELKGIATKTTHNRMEITAVIESLEFILKKQIVYNSIKLFTDSQYIVGISLRTNKLISKNFKTNRGNQIQNYDLVIKLIELMNSLNIELIKVKAHQKMSGTPNYNREVDILCRKLLRQQVNEKP